MNRAGFCENFFQRVRNFLPLLLLSVFVGGGCTATKPDNKIAVSPALAKQHALSGQLVESLGIRVTGLVLSSAGYMLDLRYRVLDVAKAASLMDRKIKPYLLVESTGLRVDIPNTPKLGLLRQVPKNSGAEKDREYFIIFANPGHVLQSGDKVSMVIGDVKIENLSVQ
jgi:hypothetical protein